MNRYFYSIIEPNNDIKGKFIHLLGNVYKNNEDDKDTCYRIAEWNFFYRCIGEIQEMMKKEIFFNYVDERIRSLGDITKEEAENLCKTYYDGKQGKELSLYNVTETTPCGNYWFDVTN